MYSLAWNPAPLMAREDRAPYSRSPIEIESDPVEAEVARRVRHAGLDKRIRAAQKRVLELLGDEADRYLRLEELMGLRSLEREEALFDLGFEHGLAQGRAEGWIAALRPEGARRRSLLARIARLAVSGGSQAQALASLLEAAWSLAVGLEQRR